MRFTQSRCAAFKPPPGKADHLEIDDDMPGFGMRFRNGGHGSYFVQYRIGRKDGRISLGKVAKVTLADARIAARKHFATIADKVDPSVVRANTVAARANTIEPLVADFLDFLARNGRSKSYLAENARSLNRYFKSLHRFSAADINRSMVAKELSRIRSERGPIAADRSRAHLSKFFSWAIAEGLAENNPVTGTNKTGSKPRTRVLGDNELAAIWKALGDDDHGTICKLLILTGARREEIGGLYRREINLEQKQIELPGQRTKNGLEHIIPLSPLALTILKSRDPRDDSDFTFGRGEGGFSGWSQCKERLDKKLDLDGWVLHDFRRTLSTVMHEKLKVPPHIVEAVINHISGARSGVAGVYNRAVYADEKRSALEKYSDHIDGLTNPRSRLKVVR